MAAGPNNRFLGKFRGRVWTTTIRCSIGRITVEVPDVLGDEPSTWALPCLPFTGPEAGQFVVPPPGAGCGWSSSRAIPVSPSGPGVGTGTPTELPPDARRRVQPASQAKPVVVQTPGHTRS